MRTIAHLSDLHFGAVDPETVPEIVTAVAQADPDLVVVSGDLTQRARARQFAAARAFLDQLPRPQIVVPGNHDVPLWNLLARGFTPIEKYKRFIGPELEPFFADEEMAVLGLNTARAFTIQGGRINRRQAERVRAVFERSPEKAMRIVVTHHPFDDRRNVDRPNIVGRAAMAMRVFAIAGVDVVLSGHQHLARAASSAIRYPGHRALLVQAGTATSFRQRGETNSFNLLRVSGAKLAIDRLEWDPTAKQFTKASSVAFRETEEGWREVA
ncbi:MAG TPA: metallophosphoesterase [Candidatus Cybelea sp.]|nr:metallophosphoesterase [Candidatus Cybelea sp.]